MKMKDLQTKAIQLREEVRTKTAAYRAGKITDAEFSTFMDGAVAETERIAKEGNRLRAAPFRSLAESGRGAGAVSTKAVTTGQQTGAAGVRRGGAQGAARRGRRASVAADQGILDGRFAAAGRTDAPGARAGARESAAGSFARAGDFGAGVRVHPP
jgi:hypothetical protein